MDTPLRVGSPRHPAQHWGARIHGLRIGCRGRRFSRRRCGIRSWYRCAGRSGRAEFHDRGELELATSRCTTRTRCRACRATPMDWVVFVRPLSARADRCFRTTTCTGPGQRSNRTNRHTLTNRRTRSAWRFPRGRRIPIPRPWAAGKPPPTCIEAVDKLLAVVAAHEIHRDRGRRDWPGVRSKQIAVYESLSRSTMPSGWAVSSGTVCTTLR